MSTKNEKYKNILNEAYFGKHPLIREIEVQINLIRKKVLNNNFYDATNSKENKIITKNLEKLFNVESVSLIWNSDINILNSETKVICQTLQFKNKLETTRSSNGIKFKNSKGIHFCIVLNNSLFSNAKLTSGEVTAALLHEIGHNFYNTNFFIFISKYITLVSTMSDLAKNLRYIDISNIKQITANSLDLLSRSNSMREFNKKTSDKYGNVLKYPVIVKNLLEISNQLINLIESFSDFNNILFNVLTYPKRMLLTTPVSVIFSLTSGLFKKYESELFSDTFVSMYGYSNELVQLRLKIENTSSHSALDNYISHVPILKYINTYYNQVINCGATFLTFNDNGRTSSLNQIEYLKKELKNSKLDPRLQEELKKQIKGLEELYEYSVSTKHTLETANLFRLLFSKILGKRMDKINLSKSVNNFTYTIRGKEYDPSFENILDKKQFY